MLVGMGLSSAVGACSLSAPLAYSFGGGEPHHALSSSATEAFRTGRTRAFMRQVGREETPKMRCARFVGIYRLRGIARYALGERVPGIGPNNGLTRGG